MKLLIHKTVNKLGWNCLWNWRGKTIVSNEWAALCIRWSGQWRVQDFPDGGANPPGWGCQPIIWPNFPRKLHENERNWTQGCRGSQTRQSTVVYYWACLLHQACEAGWGAYIVCPWQTGVCSYIMAWPKVKVTLSDIPFCSHFEPNLA